MDHIFDKLTSHTHTHPQLGHVSVCVLVVVDGKQTRNSQFLTLDIKALYIYIQPLVSYEGVNVYM